MKNIMQWSVFLIISIGLIAGSVDVSADDDVFGIRIEQRALDVLLLASARMLEVREATDAEQVFSIKAKLVVADVFQSDEFAELFPTMMFQMRMEFFKAYPDMVRVNLTSNLGELQFLVTGSEALAILPEDGVFARVNIPQLLPEALIFPEDDGGLFTLLNLIGGIPYGSLFGVTDDGDGSDDTTDVEYVEELGPDDLRAIIAYRGKDVTAGGIVHVVTIASVVNNQYIKVLVLEDTLDLYQISIEDERGTEAFLVLDEVNIGPVLPAETFTLDTSGLTEVDEDEFLTLVLLSMAAATTVDTPIAADLYASSHKVAQTGMITIHTDGFDMQDMEYELICEVEYMATGGSWAPLTVIEYAGLAPLGHWNAIFAPDETTELGTYSFRVRYTNSLGNTSEWLEAMDIVTVMPAPPRVAQTIPVMGERDVPISTDISVIFSKPMNKATVERGFTLNSRSGRVVSGSFTWEENTLIFSPSVELSYESTYLVRVDGESLDTDGIGLDGNFDSVSDGIPYDDYVWSFTTTAAVPTLTFAPMKQTIYKEDKLDVKIMAKHVTDMYKFSFKVVFDPAILEVETVDRDFFKLWKPRPKLVENADLWSEPVIDNRAGAVTIACDATRDDGVSGTGYIATISFRAVGLGTKSIGFSEVSMSDYNGQSIDVELDIVQVQVIEFHLRDTNHDGVVDILDFVDMASEESDESQAAPSANRPALRQNFPNPFNPETWIPYQLDRPSFVNIRIYRSTGEIIRTLDLGYRDPGFYVDRTKAAHWDGTDDTGQIVSSGIYFYTIQAGEFAATRKMIVAR